MESRIMYVFYDRNCLPFKDVDRKVHYPIVGNSFLGASNTTKIRFYIGQIGDIEDTWVANTKLPNGKMGNYLFKETDKKVDIEYNEPYLELELNSFYTQAKGDVYISLNGFYGGVVVVGLDSDGQPTDDPSEIVNYTISGIPTIQATGVIKLAINYATPLIDGEDVEVITLAQVLAEVGTKLDRESNKYLKIIDNITNLNTDDYDFIKVNDIIYSVYDKKFYKVTSGLISGKDVEEITLNLGNLNAGIINALGLKISFSAIYDDELGLTLTEYINNGLANKVDKKTTSGAYVYGHSNSTETEFAISQNATANSVVLRTSGGQVNVPSEPSDNSNATSKEYVDTQLAGKQDELTFDLTPTNGSTNPVTSNGVYNYSYPRNETYTQQEVQDYAYSKQETQDYVQGYAYSKSDIDTKLTSMLTYKGTYSVAEINAFNPLDLKTGYFYNVSDSGIITLGENEFDVGVGDNIVWTGTGFDKIGLDLSIYDDKFIAAGFFEVLQYDQSTGEITFVYSSELYDMSYNSSTGILTIEAN